MSIAAPIRPRESVCGYVTLAGHSRVEAAIAEGHTHADLFVVPNATLEKMLRIYGIENATQRGTDSTSVSGTVAGAIRLIAKGLLTHNPQNCGLSKKGQQIARGHLTNSRGLGADIVSDFLRGIPGMNEATVKAQIANLQS